MKRACKPEECATAPLQVVWRNPLPPTKNISRLERLVLDEYGAVYAVHLADSTKVFEIFSSYGE